MCTIHIIIISRSHSCKYHNSDLNSFSAVHMGHTQSMQDNLLFWFAASYERQRESKREREEHTHTHTHTERKLFSIWTDLFFQVLQSVSTRANQQAHKIYIWMLFLWNHHLVTDTDYWRPGTTKIHEQHCLAVISNTACKIQIILAQANSAKEQTHCTHTHTHTAHTHTHTQRRWKLVINVC